MNISLRFPPRSLFLTTIADLSLDYPPVGLFTLYLSVLSPPLSLAPLPSEEIWYFASGPRAQVSPFP